MYTEECEAKCNEITDRLVGLGFDRNLVQKHFDKHGEPRAMVLAALTFGQRHEKRCREATERYSAQAAAYLRQQGLTEARIGQILMTVQEVVCGPPVPVKANEQQLVAAEAVA